GLPAAPAGAVKPFVPELVVLAARHDIDAVGPPGDGRRLGGDDPAERLPAAPGGAVEDLMPELVVLAADEHVGSAGSEGRGRRPTDHDAAEWLPDCRELDRKLAPQLGSVAVIAERPHPRAAQIV